MSSGQGVIGVSWPFNTTEEEKKHLDAEAASNLEAATAVAALFSYYYLSGMGDIFTYGVRLKHLFYGLFTRWMQVLRPKDLETFHLVCQVTALSSEANVYGAHNPTICMVYAVTHPLECVSWSSSGCSSLRGTDAMGRFWFTSLTQKKEIL